ncbi:MAG: COG2426 family protein [Clostridia bacterium]
MENLLQLITKEVRVLIVAATPIIELRGAIPVGLSYGMSIWHAFILSYLGSLLPVPFIVFTLRPIIEWLKKGILKPVVEKISDRALLKGKKVQKYGFLGLIILVAIPLPGTGVWTGTMAATLIDMRFKWILPAVMIGNLIAGIIVTFITHNFVMM